MKQDRLSEIRRLLLQNKRITCEELCNHYQISPATVRRDLDILEREGTIRRFYGGAELIDRNEAPLISEIVPTWQARTSMNMAEKQAIAREISAMIPDACTVYLDSGTTVYEVACLLAQRSSLTIITNSLRTAALLGMNEQLQVYCVGGIIKADMLTTAGVLANEGLDFFPSIDICVLSADGFMESWGIRDWSMEGALLKKAAIDRSKQVIVAIDHTKFDIAATSPICPTKKLDAIVTDERIKPQTLHAIHGSGVSVVVAKI